MKPFTMAGSKFVAISVACLLTTSPANANVVALGVVTHAEHAHLGQAEASVGTTIYDGDNVSTDLGGTLVVSARAVTLELAPKSSLTLQRRFPLAGDVAAELTAGRLVFSAAQNASVAVIANDASIRPAANAPAVAYVQLINKRELRILVRRGAVEFTYQGESAVIPEGKAYRVLLDPSDKELVSSSDSRDSKTAPVKHRPKFLFLAIALSLAITLPLLIHAFESPDHP